MRSLGNNPHGRVTGETASYSEFQAYTTTPKGWPVLRVGSEARRGKAQARARCVQVRFWEVTLAQSTRGVRYYRVLLWLDRFQSDYLNGVILT